MIIKSDIATRRLYATDASVYQELPVSVAFPENSDDCIALVKVASKNKTSLIFRAAGTSIAGQCGQVVDVSRFLTCILGEPSGNHIRVQPGVIHSDLDLFLKPFNLKFAPEISTSNRCMIGGMIGNNAAGSHSVIYGTTREHVVAIEALLTDGTVVEFGPLTDEQLQAKCTLPTREGEIYRTVTGLIKQHRLEILKRYPKPEIIRRNTGYPLDVLAQGQPWVKSGSLFNLAPFLCGTEGTLALTLSATLNLIKIPKAKGLGCIHFTSLEQAMVATPAILKHQPAAIELMDKRLLGLTENHIAHRRNRQWIVGTPEAVLAVEFFGDSDANIAACFKQLIADLKQRQLGYAHPVISKGDESKVWAIRKAGLGLLMGVNQRKKPVAVIEDSAVAPSDLLSYTKAISGIMAREKINCVYYGHASVGLLHLRPELDLAKAEDRLLFTAVAEEVADLVKRFNGSLSGEHGDGRLRGPFLKKMVGAELYNCHVEIKKAFDPDTIFNPGKILTKEPIDAPLRVAKSDRQWQGETGFDWAGDLGLPAVVDKCNGAAVCRKSAGDGALCPSYHATGEELYNTRGRSNMLRFLLRSGRNFKQELLNSALVKSMDFCLSCKACQSECPASVDMARLKAEYLYQRRLAHGWSFKDRGVLMYPYYLRLASKLPALANRLQATTLFKKMAGVSPQRQLPAFAAVPFKRSVGKAAKAEAGGQNIILLVDVFTQYQNPQVAEDAVTVLKAASLTVHPVLMKTSPRQLISQGLLAEAKTASQQLLGQINAHPIEFLIVGLEPSELLVLRDELVSLVGAEYKEQASGIKSRAFLLEELLATQFSSHNAVTERFTQLLKQDPVRVAIHTHCHQKSWVGNTSIEIVCSLLPGVTFSVLKTGCCGMAGQLGYENPEFSEKVAKTSFLPALTTLDKETVLIAGGCSCRAQAAILADIKALHPAVFLAERLFRE
ncbi:MAG TPA: FAD-binding oxidoreductase [Methylococcaceae bacterium]|nr:FAD-binding oxidoreductase [Methylococcaceae bacterium]